MRGLMQDHPLLISNLLEFAARYHGETEIVSRRVEGDLHYSSYAQAHRRAMQCANALDVPGLETHDRAGTLAWNGYRHFELYCGVSGSERILHAINPRIHPDRIAWIVNHADDRALFFEVSFAPIIQAIASQCPDVRHWIALCDADAIPPELVASVPGVLSYEALLATQPASYAWPVFDEKTAAALCYTSGTTGHPKGVLYSHRSTVLHAQAAALPDAMGLSSRDSVLPVVPMFHVNAWGVACGVAMTGCKLVFPGPRLDAPSLHALMRDELAAGVPTVWLGLLDYMRAQKLLLPVVQVRQGRPLFGVELRIEDDAGNELACDGLTSGNLLVRGPWIATGYYRSDESGPMRDGGFPTGDVATVDPDGYMQITDRTKDVIKSGGEWSSSIELENIAMAHPGVGMAACIARPDPKWGERPLLVVVPRAGANLDRESVLAFFEGKLVACSVPDDVVFVDAMPMGPTGKILKIKLREELRQAPAAGGVSQPSPFSASRITASKARSLSIRRRNRMVRAPPPVA